MNKNSLLYLLFAALLIVMAGCGPDPFFIPVASIEGVPETGTAGIPLALTAKVRPVFASNAAIVWLLRDAGTTGASISGNILNTQAGGAVLIRAVIINGIAEGMNYIQDFFIIIAENGSPPVIPVTWYEVTFESDGGSAVASQRVEEGGYAARPGNPVKAGFGFDNWYSDSGLTTVYNFTTPVIGNITLYAKWIPLTTYMVTFNTNGGNEIPNQTVYEGGRIDKPTNPDKSGYKFVGWYREEALSNPWVFELDTVTGNITLYAKWVAVFTVTFEPNGGNTPASQIVEEGGKAARPGNPVRAGFDFDNWYSDSGLTTVYNFNTPVTGNITLYAKWVQLISGIALDVIGPLKGETPDTTAVIKGATNYTADAVSWSPGDNPFQGNKQYTATVTATAHTGSKFPASVTATINGEAASIISRTDTSVTISYQFAATSPKVVTNIAISSQPAKLIYTHDDPIDLTGLSVKLTYDDTTTEDIAFAYFTAKNIFTDPAHDEKLSHTTHDGQSVQVWTGIHNAYTDKLTVNKATPVITFPTAAEMTYGMTLAQSALTGGAGTPPGAFTWQNTAVIPTVTNSGYPVVFTPTNTVDYDFTGVSGWGGATVTRSVAIKVNPKTITITPHSNQSKVYGAADPLPFTYTPNESLLSGNNFSGVLGRDAGENAGEYAFTLGNLSAGNNYDLVLLAGNVVFTINKANGAAVTAPVISWNAALNRIDINPVSAPTTGQSVEYAISTASDGSGLGAWQNNLSYPVSSAGTYYVYARSAQGTNYNAGAASVSAGLTLYSVTFNANGGSAVTAQLVQSGGNVNKPADPTRPNYIFGGWYKESAFNSTWNFATDTVNGNTSLHAKWTVSQDLDGFEIKPNESPTVTYTGLIIHRSSANGPSTAKLTVSSGYTDIKWFYNDTPLGTGPELILDSSNPVYNMIGKKFVRVEATKDGVPYITNIEFEVKP